MWCEGHSPVRQRCAPGPLEFAFEVADLLKANVNGLKTRIEEALYGAKTTHPSASAVHPDHFHLPSKWPTSSKILSSGLKTRIEEAPHGAKTTRPSASAVHPDHLHGIHSAAHGIHLAAPGFPPFGWQLPESPRSRDRA